ncbi:SHOCT domain-containing protein [Streptomyces sp. A5-4]|uniref:SHOCT domain-containing protein n=1 Tax=Streptomyces sp. A5-4 TaxID=3384771 RepID=UPI003DA7D1AF
MHTLAHEGPGPWILFFPLLWAVAVIGVVTLLRRTGWRGRRGPRQADRSFGHAPHGDNSPIAMLGRRFAAGEIDEDEYWRRLSVLDEQFGHQTKGGAA